MSHSTKTLRLFTQGSHRRINIPSVSPTVRAFLPILCLETVSASGTLVWGWISGIGEVLRIMQRPKYRSRAILEDKLLIPRLTGDDRRYG